MIQLACASLSCDGFGDNDFVRTFELLPELGYRNIEFDLWHPGNLTRSKIIELRRRCAEAGLQPIAVYSTSFGVDKQHELVKDVTHKLRMIEAALELGCQRIVMTGAGGRPEGGLTAVIKVLEHLTPEAELQGVDICLENHHGHSIDTIEDYEAIFKAIPSSRVGMCVDTGHFQRSGINLLSLAERFEKRINHIHLKDFLANGQTDNHGFMQYILKTDYSGYLTIEHVTEDWDNVDEDLMAARTIFEVYER